MSIPRTWRVSDIRYCGDIYRRAIDISELQDSNQQKGKFLRKHFMFAMCISKKKKNGWMWASKESNVKFCESRKEYFAAWKRIYKKLLTRNKSGDCCPLYSSAVSCRTFVTQLSACAMSSESRRLHSVFLSQSVWYLALCVSPIRITDKHRKYCVFFHVSLL